MRYTFADCVLDTDSFSFYRKGEPVSVEPQVFDLLRLLAENPNRLISKDRLVETIWDGRIVSDATISARINAARMAVGDSGKAQAVIRTVQRRGIELVVQVETGNGPLAPPKAGGVATARQTIRYATSMDGTKIAYAISGRGPSVMRAGHFLTHLEKDWSSPVWGPYLEALSARYSLVRYDQRGTGLSDPDLADTSVQAFANDLLAVADAAGLDRFPLVASSQGVPTSLQFAADHPRRVSCLVLYGGFAQGESHRRHGNAEEATNALLELIRAGWGDPRSAFMVAFTSVFCPGASKAELENLVEIQLASTTPENAARIRAAIDRFDVTACLEAIEAPTLVIHASNDAVHPVSQGRMLAASIRHAEFLQVESENHIYLPSDAAWQDIVSAQMEFIDRHN